MANAIRLLRRKYVYETTLQTNISTHYVDENTSSTWGAWELVRECMQNVMDEAEAIAQAKGGHLSDHLHVTNTQLEGADWWQLRDMGRGTDPENILYLGFSGKRGQGRRGEKGEGQLLAFLVAARKGIGLVFASQDYLLIPKINDDGHPHLVLALYRARKPIVGTRIYIENTPPIEIYLKRRRKYFPDLVKPKGPGKSPSKRKIFDPDDEQAKLYLRGIYVRDIDALFSYNLAESRISRDRDVVSEDDLIEEVGQVWNEVINLRKVTRLLEEATAWSTTMLEMRILDFTLGQKQNRIWRKAFREVAGHSRAVLWTNDLITREARRKSYVVIRIERQPVFDTLLAAGVKRDCDVAKAQDPYKELRPSKRERATFAIMEDIADRCNWENSRTFKVFKPTGADASYDNRLAFQRGNYLYFNRFHLASATFGDLLQTFVHEETHRQFSAPDESREFEAGQAKLWLDIVKYASKHVNHQLVTWNAQQTQFTQIHKGGQAT